MPLAAFPKCFIEKLVLEAGMRVEEWVVMSAGFDIDGLEFYSGFASLDDLPTWEGYGQLAARHGRSAPMLCHSSDFTHPDPAERRRALDLQRAAVDAASALGAQYCRVLSGQRRPEVSRADGIDWVRECITDSIAYAEKRRIVLILENHYKDHTWLYPEFAQKREIFLELLAALPESPYFGVNYDPSNAIIAGEDPITLLEAVKHRVVTMHASDRFFQGGSWEELQKHDMDPVVGYASILAHGVIGRGLNDYDKIFSILRAAGFKGWVSIEDGPDPLTGPEDIRQSAVFLRQKMREHGLP